MLKPPSDKISAETREKLLALAEFIETDERHAVRMEAYASFVHDRDLPEPAPAHFCGTAYCLAGYVLAGEGLSVTEINGLACAGTSAGEQLGLTDEQSFRLFFGYPANRPVVRAKAVRVLRNLAYTGEVDWGV